MNIQLIVDILRDANEMQRQRDIAISLTQFAVDPNCDWESYKLQLEKLQAEARELKPAWEVQK